MKEGNKNHYDLNNKKIPSLKDTFFPMNMSETTFA